jgi:hypothetical protein
VDGVKKPRRGVELGQRSDCKNRRDRNQRRKLSTPFTISKKDFHIPIAKNIAVTRVALTNSVRRPA